MNKINKNATPIRLHSGVKEPVFVVSTLNHVFVWCLLFTGVLVMGSTLWLVFFLDPDSQPRITDSRLTQSSADGIAKRISGDVELLKGQMNLLITDAMESKISLLEQSLRRGSISPGDLLAVQELKENLHTLRALSLGNRSLHKPTFDNVSGNRRKGAIQSAIYPEEVLHEIANIRNLVFLSIASWGFAIVVFGGVWLRSFYRMKQIQNEYCLQYQLLEKPKSHIS